MFVITYNQAGAEITEIKHTMEEVIAFVRGSLWDSVEVRRVGEAPKLRVTPSWGIDPGLVLGKTFARAPNTVPA